MSCDVVMLDVFQQLFRQDLLLASLFRNYLLAERVLNSMSIHPVAYPPLPKTSNHPLWKAWNVLDLFITRPGTWSLSTVSDN